MKPKQPSKKSANKETKPKQPTKKTAQKPNASLSILNDKREAERAINAGKTGLQLPSEARLRELMRNLSHPPGGPGPFAAETTAILSIEQDLADDEQFSDDALQEGSGKFRFWHVEALLNSSADLLDRCIAERTAYDDLKSKWMEHGLDVIEFDRLQAVHDQEVVAGWYTLPFQQSFPEKLGNSVTQVGFKDAAVALSTAISAYGNGGATDAALLAKLNALGVYNKTNALTYRKVNNDGDDAANGTLQYKKVQNLASSLATRDTALASGNVAAQHSTLELEEARKAKSDWDKNDIKFRRLRSEEAIAINALHKRMMSDPGGPFNFLEQLEPIKKRYRSDLSDALSRLIVAKNGLGSIFGLDLGSVPHPSESSPGNFIVDSALRWTREAIRTVNALGMSDQQYPLTLSVKSIMGETWETAIGAIDDEGSRGLTLTFELPSLLFQGQRLVRLRGMSMSLVGVPGYARAVGWASIPGHARVWPHDYISDPDNGGSTLDQTGSPSVRFGRVRSVESVIPEDLVGLGSMMNLSPIGNPEVGLADRSWSILIEWPWSNQWRLSEIDDVLLTLYISAQVQA